MANITLDDVKKVAVLSGFALSDEELHAYRAQFEEIIDYVEKLNHLQTDGLEPTYQVNGLTNVTREDELIDYQVSTEALLQNVPEQQDNQIKVRRVL